MIEPGDGPGLADALRRLAADPAAVAAMGRNARGMLDACFSRRAALSSWSRLLATVEAEP